VPADVVDKWLRNRRAAVLNQVKMRPLEHTAMPGTVLSIQKGQAEAFPLKADDGSEWILKKFYQARLPDRTYLETIGNILPQHNGLQAGTARRVLAAGDLVKSSGCHHSSQLAQWLDGTVLMPRISGIDWAMLADEIRDGNLNLGPEHRLLLCRNLAELIVVLEQHKIAHRDLSCGNVFIETNSWNVCLIDFDSLYHPNLSIPAGTTCGTIGYAAPFAWDSRQLDPTLTWCPCADRYALAILCTEFLALDAGSPLTAEGGMFDQDQLCRRKGTGVSHAISRLESDYPAAASLFERAIKSKGHTDCPTPELWLNISGGMGAAASPPELDELENVVPDFFENVLRKQRPAAPLWPAPSLDEMPFDSSARPAVPVGPLAPSLGEMPLEVPKLQQSSVSQATSDVELPEDPWAS